MPELNLEEITRIKNESYYVLKDALAKEDLHLAGLGLGVIQNKSKVLALKINVCVDPDMTDEQAKERLQKAIDGLPNESPVKSVAMYLDIADKAPMPTLLGMRRRAGKQKLQKKTL